MARHALYSELAEMAANERALATERNEMDDAKATMTLNLTQREMAVLEQLANVHDMSKTAVMRQALRLYQMVEARIAAGETMSFSGDKERIVLFIGPGIGE